MPRTWGYIIIVAALVVGAAALMLPLPESVDLAPVEQPRTDAPAAPTPAPRSPATRARGQKTEPAPSPAVAPVPKPSAPPVPMQDTTKTRQLIQPKRNG
jgi:hypothetical protein